MSTRAAALAQLNEFLERVPDYAAARGYDRPGHHDVSRLSPYIRHRVITEEEVVTAVCSRHSPEVCEKFIQEVMWRTYWKGWLELRPSVWNDFRCAAAELEPVWRETDQYRRAVHGDTGLSFFNDWARELVSTGYLHNHTRMWFASVWIFTLQLPWQLGASFMYRHLRDGDPASNTLSWRWVGGLHTKGKVYVARPDNIEKYSEGRWRPADSQLNLNPKPLSWEEPPSSLPLEPLQEREPQAKACVLMHDDDLSSDLSAELKSTASSYCVLASDLSHRSALVAECIQQLRHDAVRRTQGRLVAEVAEIAAFVADHGGNDVVSMMPRCGHLTPTLLGMQQALQEKGIKLRFVRRQWDSRFFPKARAGFFSFWESYKKHW